LHPPARRQFVHRAMVAALRELHPRAAVRRPLVLAAVLAGALATASAALHPHGFTVAVAAWMWLLALVLALSEVWVQLGAGNLTRRFELDEDLMARRLRELRRDAQAEIVSASRLRRGDLVHVPAGDRVPADGVV